MLGIGLALIMVTAAASAWVPVLRPVSGGLSLLVGVAGLLRVTPSQRILTIVLTTFGVVALAIAVLLGARPAIADLLNLNQLLLGMLAAVAFVRLVAPTGAGVVPRVTGAPAVWRTGLTVHVLGSVLNIGAVDIVGERLLRRGRLSLADSLLLSRAYSAGAFWSPFWAASAAAMAAAPGAQSGVLLFCGIMIALVAMAISIGILIPTYGEQLRGYHGYAMSWRLLWLPVTLALVTIGAHLLLPAVEFTVVVLISAFAVSVVVLAITRPRVVAPVLGNQVVRGLPAMRGEAVLFTSAGVMAVGLRALVDTTGISLPIASYDVWVAWVCTIVMATITLIGVHPVISIAALAALLAPLHPDPTLFALSAVIAWATSAAVGPVSGLNVYLAGRFGVNSFQTAKKNLPYLGVVIVLALPALALCAALT